MTPDQRDEYEERAAIMQYDGKMDRETAERLARECVLKQGINHEKETNRAA